MKKLITICLIIATTFTVKAQDTKPTKEQTINFIKDYFSNQEVGWTLDGGKYYLSLQKNYDLSLVGTILTIGIDECLGDCYAVENVEYTKTSKKIDLKNIESISISQADFTGGRHCDVKLNFNFINNKEKYELYINNGRDCSKAQEFEKIKKAFNHLRKLCGAPDPINFDGN